MSMFISRSTRQTVLFSTALLMLLSCHGKGEVPRAQQAGTNSADFVVAAAVDNYGNIYVTGYTYGGLDGNRNADPSGATADVFVVKYDGRGMKLWTRQLGTAADDLAFGIAVDVRGNVSVAGCTSGGLDGNVNAGSADIFLVRIDADGVKRWTRQLGSAADDVANGVAADRNGNVYLAGYTTGGLDGNVSAGLSDLVLVKYDANGAKTWSRQEGTAADDAANAVAVDGHGALYVAGDTGGDIVVMKFDPGGAVVWTNRFGFAADDRAFGIAVDATGNLFVTGSTLGGLDGNANADPSGATADIFLSRITSGGVRMWTRQTGTAGDDFAFGLSPAYDGSVYVAGDTTRGLHGWVNADPSGTSPDYFLIKYDAAGLRAWTRQSGSRAADAAVAVVSYGSTVHLAGYTYGWLDGNIPAGDADLFFVSYDEYGVKQ
jgi:3D (Asp-Asp-Asp) domain-containing protein